MNLGINAAHAMADAGRLDIEIDEVDADRALAGQVPGLQSGRFVRLTVRDTGSGMDGETLSRIFEPFYSTKSAGDGTGLGLSVVYGIVKEHGGAIGVKSAPGQGTEFRIYFPALAGTAQEPITPPQPSVAAPRGHGERLLFVDDEEDLAILSQRLLQTMGYKVRACRTGEDALATFGCEPDAFDAVITDLTMPGMSGLDLAEKLRAIRPGLPVIVMSGHIRDVDSQRAHALGLGEIHWKPNTVIDLAETLRLRLIRSKD
jgi:CheY-like chemotaxis protein